MSKEEMEGRQLYKLTTKQKPKKTLKAWQKGHPPEPDCGEFMDVTDR